MNSVKTGYSLGPLLGTSELVECAKIADQNPATDSIWIPESWGRESFSSLGAISQVTRRVRLGTSIISMYARTPATVAMAALTVDSISNGRAVIGIGASTEAIVENLHGMAFERPAERIKEYITCIRQLTRGERVDHVGRFFKIHNFKLLEKPTRMKIPLYMAAINEKMISAATDVADGVLLYLRPIYELHSVVRRIREATKNKDFEIALSIICAVSDHSRADARLRARKTLAFYISVGKYYRRFIADNGFEDEVQKISKAYSAAGVDAAASNVPDRMLDSLTIAGTRKECRERFADFRSTGISLAILQFNPVGTTESSFRELLSTF